MAPSVNLWNERGPARNWNPLYARHVKQKPSKMRLPKVNRQKEKMSKAAIA
jgi:hypothetical protein